MLESILHFKNQIFTIANAKTRRNFSTKFSISLDERLKYGGEIVPICLKLFLKNFKLLYAFT
jgi:hypothetical protein